MLKQRIITALWGLPLLIVAVWFDRPWPWFTILLAGGGLLAVYEFYRLVNTTQIPPLTVLGLVFTLLFIVSPHFGDRLTPSLLLSLAVIVPLVWLLGRPQRAGVFIGWAWTVGGIFYVGGLLRYLVLLRGLDDGRNWLLLALLATIASDSTAFFVGRALGRHHLAPRISPAKTWEGAVGGVLGAVLVSLLFRLPTLFYLPLSYGQALLLGLLVSIFAQVGDLVESLLKRQTGVKDSGRLVPGHGGILDRIDGLIFAGVLVYYYGLAYQAGWLNWL
ncbi:MAG: phosphatidate cytidylyltransferase [Chloroflexota bacterium]